ncbi:uncharacterized protein LOC123712226 [Pieris brassicae]|uniref:uncharacterized protein LOC123712226 n=1 Tax=Pieris brassicae TaxID=7116 RepID=UPI001E65E80B|nr:uncharacterized protein LOC123712226 [Pieris brassicae]
MAKSEFLSEDILDEEYMKAFEPFHHLQMALGSCRLNIRDRFVSSPTTAQKIFSICCVTITLVLYIYSIRSYFIRYYEFTGIYVTSIISIVLYYLTFFFNIIHIRFINCSSNPRFYIKLQEIDRLMNLNKNEKFNNVLYWNNVISAGASVLVLLMAFCLTMYENAQYFMGIIGLLYSVLTCNLEWLYCADLMMYFFLRIRFINAIILNHLQGTVGPFKYKAINLPTYYFIRCLASETHDFQTNCVDLYLKAVFEGFTSFQNHYRFQMLLFCNQFVLLSLLTFEIGLGALQYNALRWSEIITLPTILICNTLLAIFLCIRCEVFYRETKKTKRLCITMMSRYCDGPLREKAKRILKIIEQRPIKFNVYNMWSMNAFTVIRILNIVTTMMVVLLQFTFL